ncbi:hypothetical protein KSP9073_02434 [Kushneria phyllosphaerae]|uniref:Uncharacterized protein n=1 Tax=Kushneria phyllosphaerae TaxID=2100822 RepID=A0A2R8CND0_9GAMM|nr:hypothetical protein KSP9073_02434 [Kushneria phyllosphaerae]
MASLLITMAVATTIWCGISLWLASSFGRADRSPMRPVGDEHALIITGAAAAKPRTSDDSANDDEYDALSTRRARREWTAV